jgi:hypothetical protein
MPGVDQRFGREIDHVVGRSLIQEGLTDRGTAQTELASPAKVESQQALGLSSVISSLSVQVQDRIQVMHMHFGAAGVIEPASNRVGDPHHSGPVDSSDAMIAVPRAPPRCARRSVQSRQG